MKKALVHDWYYVNGGAEKVIHSFNNVWEDFDHYALIDFLPNKDREFVLKGKNANTSFIQKLPTAKSNHRKFLQLFPYAIEQFDLTQYDLILSSSASIAKGVLVHQNQLHICYCHSPMRYAWDLYHQYLSTAKLNKGLKGIYAKYVLHKLRNWDLISTNRVDHFIANSNYIAERIAKVYRREATVIYPPVNVDDFTLIEDKHDYYFTASRMVPYKRTDIIVEAFNQMPEKRLIVAGDGPEYGKLKKIANSNIEFLGYVENSQLIAHLQNAKAFVFAAEEDFGILPVEAQACGTPVIAYGRGGVRETVISEVTGLFFLEQAATSIVNAVNKFESIKFDPHTIRKHAGRFSRQRFEEEIKDFVSNKYQEFITGKK